MVRTIDYFFGELHAKKGQQALNLQLFLDFVQRVVNVLDTSVESFWACRDALADLAISRAALDYIEHELLSGLNTAHYLPQLVLLDCDRFSLHLRFLSPGPLPTTVSASVEHRMIAMVRGSAQLHRFEQPVPEPFDVFDLQRKIVPRGVSTLRAGDVMECCAGVDCYQLSVDSPAILFEMRSETVCNFQWFYDASSLAPKRIVFVDSQDMRAQLGLLTALNLNSSDSVPYVRSFLEHPNHFIRWSALKAIVHLEPEKIGAHLEAAVHDSHPQIRAAAIQLKLQVNNRGKGGANGADVAH